MSLEILNDKNVDRSQRYDPFRSILDDIKKRSIGCTPQEIWFSSTLNLGRTLKLSNQPENNLSQDTIDFLSRYGEKVFDSLMQETKLRPHQDNINQPQNYNGVTDAIHKVSEIFSEDETPETEPRQIEFLTFDQLCNLSSRFKQSIKKDENGVSRKYFYIYSESRQKWYEYPIPNSDKVIHKGGIGRTILKVLYCPDNRLIESELPANDFDYIAEKCPQAESDLKGLRPDRGGVEEVKEIDLEVIMNNRDLDLNNSFVKKDGLVFDQLAKKSAETGNIEIIATKRGIYGTEIFFHEGIRLIKNRGMMRLVKTLAEEKAKSFNFLPLNEQVDFGIYWLVLSRRSVNKPNFPELLDRMFLLGKQIKQVRPEEHNIYDVLDRVHQKYPFYDYQSELDDKGLAMWLKNKLFNQIDKKYRDLYHIPSSLTLVRSENDTTPYQVKLDYSPNPKNLEFIRNEWPNYLQRCQARFQNHQQLIEESIEEKDE